MNEEILKDIACHLSDAYVAIDDEHPRLFFFGHKDNPEIMPSEEVEIIVRRRHKTRNSLEPFVTFAGAVTV
jgi:hypothetical protein